MDITLSEHLVFRLGRQEVLRGYEEYLDLPENRTIQVYSLEEIAAEKLVALTDSARNEPRDLFDLWHLIEHAGLAIDEPIVDAVNQKLIFRGKPAGRVATAIEKKAVRLEALWSTRLAHQMVKVPSFEDVLRAVRRSLRQTEL